MKKNSKYSKIAFYASVAIALIVIIFYALNPKQDAQKDVSSNKSQVTTGTSENKAPSRSQVHQSTNTDASKSNSAATNAAEGIKIVKSEISSKAKFFPYKVDGTNMEIIAVKATDGTIRTALNTCQVCYDSGRGYYVQVGDYLICQNCGNRFHIDQIEKIKGGCNPVPILEENKKDVGSYITLSKEFIATQKQYFVNWKRS